MDLRDTPSHAAPPPPGHHAGAGTSALAAALAHILRRDGDHPARWRTPSFADAVERARLELETVGSIPALPVIRDGPGAPMGFREALARLARNPDDVAVAIRRLELGARHRLPAWPDLLRRGLPAPPTDQDTALWFG